MSAEAPFATTSATPVHLLVRLPSGAYLPATTSNRASVAELKAAVLAQCGLPPDAAQRIGLALGRVALAEHLSVAANDLCEGDIVALFERRWPPRTL